METETYKALAIGCTFLVGLYVACTLYIGLREHFIRARKVKAARAARDLLMRGAHFARQAGVAPVAIEPECASRIALASGPLRQPHATQGAGS